MGDAGAVLAAAIAERDHIAALLAAHELSTHDPSRAYCLDCSRACPKCRSLAAHLARTQEQVGLLTPPPTGEMF